MEFLQSFKTFSIFVVRDILWNKLLQYGVRGNILNVIKSMYINVKSQMKYNNTILYNNI